MCTDLPCTWSQNFATNVTAAPVSNMFYTGEGIEKLINKYSI